jgi:hypothetical protein
MSRASRLVFVLMALAAAVLPSAASAAGLLLANGDLVTIGTPLVSPPIDEFWLMRVDPVSGAVDTVCKLPTGNGPVDLDVSPVNGLVYVLARSSIYRVDPCTGATATITTGGYVAAPQPPYMNLLAHTDGNLYLSRPSTTGGIVRVDPATGAQTFLANPYPANPVTAYGLTEGPDHFVYAATSGGSGSLPWVVRVDPVSGALNVVASGVQSTNVRDIAFDTRDSLFVLREGATPSVHRIDRVTGQVGLLTNFTSAGATFGWMVAHPDGNLYTPQLSLSSQAAMYRLNPVTKSFTTVTTPRSDFWFQCVALVRGFSGCPTPVHQSSWGRIKTTYR